jgi:hypothetical protein
MNTNLTEDFEIKKAERGIVPFLKTKIDDAHIKEAIKRIAAKTGAPEAKVKTDIETEIKKFDDIAKIAPTLYNTIKLNVIEDEAFKQLGKSKAEIKGAPKFSFVIFNKLFDYIKVEHYQFFPMKSLFNNKPKKEIRVILVPSANPENKKWNDVDTAAATPGGEFIFNKDFMQRLLDWAHMKKAKPKGKKYVANGGEFPDEYCYIEFIIIHELMHFTQGDFYYSKKYKVSPTIINWVGDFRTNYLLVKSGYEQLPIGLFNDEINYDRQNTYKEMIEIVQSEFDKLNAAQKKKVGNKLKDSGDDHGKHQPSPDGDNKYVPKVGDKVRLPDGSPAIVKSITGGKVQVERVAA